MYSLAKYCIQQTQRLLQQRAKNVEALDHVMTRHKDELQKQIKTSLASHTAVANSNQRQQAVEVMSDSDDDMPPAPTVRGRGRWVCHNDNYYNIRITVGGGALRERWNR